MNDLPPFSERLQRAFRPNPGGVVRVVEDLLGLCREQGLQLDWHADRCRVRPLGPGSLGPVDVPLQKSVFRAILARMAALCNERTPNSVSPYGGEGEVSVETDPPTVFRVTFSNTPGEQRLEVRPTEEAQSEVKEFTVLLRGSGPSEADVQTFTVRGYRLQRVGNGEAAASWLGILAAPGEENVYVALFPGSLVIAAFCGEARSGAKGPA